VLTCFRSVFHYIQMSGVCGWALVRFAPDADPLGLVRYHRVHACAGRCRSSADVEQGG
jgi:hypothetical protein